MADSSSGSRKWLTPLLAILLAVLVLFAWKQYSPPGINPADRLNPAANTVYFGPFNSIAVLPFEVESSSDEQEFWSVGLSHELTRLLTLTPRLEVTSSNSALFFRGRSAPNRVIAEHLQVNHVLSGFFIFSEGKARLSLHLYNARKNKETWSREYEAENGRLSEIRETLVADLVTALGMEQEVEDIQVKPVSSEAWTAYLRGLYHQALRTPEHFSRAETAFREALALAPGYELARVALAATLLSRHAAGDPTPTLLADARNELDLVLHSNPGLPEAHGLSSYISRNYDWEWSGALESAEEAVRLNPGDPELMGSASLAMFSMGQFSRAQELMEQAVRQDPLNLAGRLRLGLLQEFSADYDAALTSYRLILEMNPDFPAARAFRARIKLIQQNPESAVKESELETEGFWQRYSRILALSASDQPGEAKNLLEEMIAEDGSHAAYQIAEILAFQGDLDGAFAWLDRAYEQRDGGMKELLGNYFLHKLHADHRWHELLSKMGLPLDLES